LAVPGIIVKAVGWKISPKVAKTAVLRTVLGLEETIGLSDIMRSSQKDANPSATRFVSEGFCGDCLCFMREPIPDDFRSSGNIQEVER
jgi:hypothetical protein